MIKVYKYSQVERLTYLRPVEDDANPSDYGEPNLGYFLTDSELKRLAQEAFNKSREETGEDEYGGVPRYEDFDHYWSKQQATKGEG